MPKQTFRTFRYFCASLALCGTALLGFPADLFSRQVEAVKSAAFDNRQPAENARVSFEENRGQFDRRVRFAARAGGAVVFLTAAEAVYVLPMAKRPEPGIESREPGDIFTKDQRPETADQTAFALRMKLVGANPASTFAGEELRAQRSNYFKGADAAGWQTDVRNFGAVRFENVYDGVSMLWRGRENGATQYDFIVAPNRDAGQIALEFDGADALEIDAGGNLLIHTAAGTIKQAKPFTYQETGGVRREIESRFVIEAPASGNSKPRIRFALGAYDRTQPLTIDPTVTLNNLAFSTFLGSFADDLANDIAVDANGNAYVTGRTLSASFPAGAGAFDPTANGSEDVFVTKINASGTGIVFSTFLGGAFYDEGGGIAVDASGNIFVTGTASSGFPTTAAAFDTTFNGGADVFVAKLNAAGSSLIYSTYIGASNIDAANDLAIDAAGSAYIVVRTSDAVVDYPTTAGAFDTTFNGIDDVAVTKLNEAGTALVYSTFLGGSSIDSGRAIAVNAGGEAYVTGATTDDATDFPTTAGAYDPTHNGVTDFFVTKLNAGGTALIYSTFLGGAGIDNANALAIDSAGSAYVAGSISSGFPTTVGAFDTVAAGSSEIGLSKLSPDGATLLYSTYLGGTQGESANAVAVDAFGNAYVTGSNFGSGDYPTTAGAFDTTHNGSNDAVFSVVNQNGTALVYSTYLGGGGADTANDIALDSTGNIYLAGQTAASGAVFPTGTEAFQNFNGGGLDAFVSKFGDFAISGKVIDTSGNPLSNVMIALSGQVSGNVLTGADGRFGFLNTVTGEPHTVTATRAGYAINPAIFNIANLNNNRELVFVGAVGSPTGGSGGTLAFENISYNRSENGLTATLTVRRTGMVLTSEPVTVDFQTVGGAAVGGADFTPVSGVLTFNFADSAKTITVPILDDAALEPKENFTLLLSNPTNNAEINPNRAAATVNILDEDLGSGDLLISEFRQRGRLGANDEYVKIFNPHDFDVTINAADASGGVTLARANGDVLTPIATIPNLVTIGARGHYLLTNNNPAGGFSLINYPTGAGSTTAAGDQTFSADIPDNSNLVLLGTANAQNFNPSRLIDAVGFGAPVWTAEGKPLAALGAENAEMSFVRKLTTAGVQDTGDNRTDFLLVDNQARIFSGSDQTKIHSVLGAPAPENSESLRRLTAGEIAIEDFGAAVYDPSPVPNGGQGTLTVYRRITNKTGQPLLALRLRVADFPTAGSALQKRFSARPDFRLLSSADEGFLVKGVTLAAANLQPHGGGLNSTLTVDAVSQEDPLLPDQSIIVAVRFGVVRYGRHTLSLAAEGLQ